MVWSRVLSRRNLSYPSRRSPPSSAETATLTTFRINTCKSVSKQTTLTAFRMNTYEKPRGRGSPGRTGRTHIYATPRGVGISAHPRHALLTPSHAPRGASIPCALTRLRILPVTKEVAPLAPAVSTLRQLSALCASALSFACFCRACPPRWAFVFTKIQNPFPPAHRGGESPLFTHPCKTPGAQ